MYSSNIFPPIFNQAYMPAFLYTGSCRIYFALSDYNSINSLHHRTGQPSVIDCVQISVRKQTTNQSALSQVNYPSGIKLTTLSIDENRQSDDKYYVEISSSDIQGGFVLDEYYKVQIRFTQAGASSPSATGGNATGALDTWLSINNIYFSEWSRVVLIRGISLPYLTLTGYNNLTTPIGLNYLDLDINGQILFANNLQTERLKSYFIQLYDNEENLLQQSGEIFSQNNQINYSIKTELEPQSIYNVKFQIITENLYSWNEKQEVTFYTNTEEELPLNVQLRQVVNSNSGSIDIYLKSLQDSQLGQNYSQQGNIIIESNQVGDITEPNINNLARISVITDHHESILYLSNSVSTIQDLQYGTNIVIKRASSKDNFVTWEKIDSINILQTNVQDLLWSDFTIEPGIWYKYHIIRYDIGGNRTASIKINTPVMIDSQDIFLDADGKQLTICFNPDISSITIKKSEATVETIGSKYPFIRSNSNINYKTFSLSGLISCFSDVSRNLMQASKNKIYGNAKSLYDTYNSQHNINLFNDVIYERMFRDQVVKFLQKNNVKLFRSITQGNMLIKLTNISLTPIQSLNRQIYSFSCTATEVAECNFQNYEKYNILSINKVQYNVQQEG